MKKITIHAGGAEFLSRDVPDGDFAMTLGRHADCDIVLPGNGVSRRHARLSSKNGRLFIEDLNSTAGTILNEAKIAGDTPFSPGDTIRIGDYTIVVASESEAPARQPEPAAAPQPPPRPPEVRQKQDATPDFKREFANATVLYEPDTMALTRSIHENILEKLNLSEGAMKEIDKADMRAKLETCLDRT